MSSCMCSIWLVVQSLRVWLVETVAPQMGQYMSSAPSVPSPVPLSRTPSSIQWLTVSIHLCIFQALAEPFRRQLYQAPVRKHFPGFRIVYGLDIQVEQSLYGLFFSLCMSHCLHNTSHKYFIPPSKKVWSIHKLVFPVLQLRMVCELYLGHSELLG